MIQNISIEIADIADIPCDLVVLKYAQGLHGADASVAERMRRIKGSETKIDPMPGDYIVIPSRKSVAASKVLFMGVFPLHRFDYSQIRNFSRQSLSIIAEKLPDVARIAMTIHGVNYGLDERESFLAQLGGIIDAEKLGVSFEQVMIVERDAERAERLQAILNEFRPQVSSTKISKVLSDRPYITAGAESLRKPHIFVAMPFAKEMKDVYIFGIQGPVNAAGYLCERIDMATFTGDIIERVKSRIKTAALVVADLTGGNPNVYLEVGYAWGTGRSTLLLAKEDTPLTFDVRGQRCILYDSISDLAEKLSADLPVGKRLGRLAESF